MRFSARAMASSSVTSNHLRLHHWKMDTHSKHVPYSAKFKDSILFREKLHRVVADPRWKDLVGLFWCDLLPSEKVQTGLQTERILLAFILSDTPVKAEQVLQRRAVEPGFGGKPRRNTTLSKASL